MKKPQLAWIIFVFFLSTLAMGNMESTLALFTESRMNYGIPETGKLLAFVGVMIAFTQGFIIRRLAPKIGERRMVVIGPLLAGIGLLATGFTYSTAAIMSTMAILAIGSGISNPALLGGISLVADPSEQGGVMGVNQSLSSLARFLGPACGGFLFDHGVALPYYFAGVLMAVALVTSLANAKKLPDVRGVGSGAGTSHG